MWLYNNLCKTTSVQQPLVVKRPHNEGPQQRAKFVEFLQRCAFLSDSYDQIIQVHPQQRDYEKHICYIIRKQSQQTDHMDELGYWQHMENHGAVQATKEKNEELCKADPYFVVANFDLEQVRNLPQSNIQHFFYTRNFHCYKFTLWNFMDRDCVCHSCGPSSTERGSDEMASCLYDWLTVQSDL